MTDAEASARLSERLCHEDASPAMAPERVIGRGCVTTYPRVERSLHGGGSVSIGPLYGKLCGTGRDLRSVPRVVFGTVTPLGIAMTAFARPEPLSHTLGQGIVTRSFHHGYRVEG